MFGREWKFSQPAYIYRYNHLICEDPIWTDLGSVANFAINTFWVLQLYAFVF